MRLDRALGQALLGLFYPPICAGCRKAVGSDAALCISCWRGVAFIEAPFCAVLGVPLSYDEGPGTVSPAAIAEPPPFSRARAAVLHAGIASGLVAQLKYADRTDLAVLMAGWMRRAGDELLREADCVVPVPLHRARLFRRRFNQSAELARRLARPGTFQPQLLVRRRATLSQVGLGRSERQRNVAGAFVVPPALAVDVAGRRILLVDDVFTTGSTVGSASRALLRAGASAVDVLTFSRVAEGGAEPHMQD